MPYSVSILPSALRRLSALPQDDQRRIIRRVDALAVEPRPPGVKMLHGKQLYFRVRSGDYRIVYTIDDNHRSVLIIKVGHRREIYPNI